MRRNYYDPTPEHISKLSGSWCASYSRGKDSTSLVTWVELLRRQGVINVPRPRLVCSDTMVEDPALEAVGVEMTKLLEGCGWECGLVTPEVHERLYPQILGRGLPPIHPGIRRMRWCTRSTKIDPMKRWKAEGELSLTGLRMGESDIRDGKIAKSFCAAGGECGIPEPSQETYSPILHWTLCQVVDWLNGAVDRETRKIMADVFAVTRKLVEVYDIQLGQSTLGFTDPEISASRFGCNGCPAIGVGPAAPDSVVRRNGKGSPLNELYDVWFEARKFENRCYHARRKIYGPIRMAVRAVLLARVLDIQRRAGVVLITPEDEAFIRQCWANKIYPRGWSEADESSEPVEYRPLLTD